MGTLVLSLSGGLLLLAASGDSRGFGKAMVYSQMYQRGQEFITGAPPHLAPYIQLDL